MKELIDSLTSDLPLEKASVIFLAGLPMGMAYNPSVNIVVESLPGVFTLEEVVEAEIESIKLVVKDYNLYEKTKVIVGDKGAIILEWEGSVANLGLSRLMQMVVVEGKVTWTVTCTTTPEQFPALKEVFIQIVKSFRVLG